MTISKEEFFYTLCRIAGKADELLRYIKYRLVLGFFWGYVQAGSGCLWEQHNPLWMGTAGRSAFTRIFATTTPLQ
jgi:hypothetical protein